MSDRTPLGAPRHQPARSTHLAQANEIAQRQGGDQDADYTAFGPTNAGLHEVDVLLRLDDAWSALEAAQRLDELLWQGSVRSDTRGIWSPVHALRP